MALVSHALSECDKEALVIACNKVRNLETPPLLPEHRPRAWLLLLGVSADTPDSGFRDFDGNLTETNQRVIAHDCERTRAGCAKLEEFSMFLRKLW